MISIPYRATAEERLVLSRTSATAGLHESLDFLPGSVLLGCFAADHYGAWKTQRSNDAFAVFHSGKVSFGDGHPCAPDGSPTVAIPLSFHHAKATPKTSGSPALQERLIPGNIYNLTHSPWRNRGAQPVQLRSGWMNSAGRIVTIKRGHVLKTARDSSRHGVPEDSRVFGYQFVEAGQVFAGSICVDDSIPHLADEIRKWISSSPAILAGRSHRAEFGRCRLTLGDVLPSWEASQNTDASSIASTLSLYALSDLLFSGGFRHDGRNLHPLLDGYEIDASRTYLRFRSYTAWNAYRGFPDYERQVLVRGSVMMLRWMNGEGKSPPPLSEIKAGLGNGVGTGLAEGLGRVLVNPTFLAGVHPEFKIPENPETVGPTSRQSSRPATTELAAIEQRWIRRWVLLEADRLASQFVSEWRCFRPRPRRSQWAQLRQLARASISAEDFSKAFRDFVSAGAARWRWRGTSQSTGKKTIGETITDGWKQLPTEQKDPDPRAKVGTAREQAFLAAVAEAARRLRDA
jgi:CRISPR-associated protein Csx10